MNDNLEKQEAQSGEQAPAKRKAKNRVALVGIVVGVVVILGVGFTVWHNQPSFCNAICHTPMTDSYLETLEAEPGQHALDKWGNDVADAQGMLASVHGHLSTGSTGCMGCHVPTLNEQVGEAAAWLTGDYAVTETGAGDVILEKNLAQLVEASGDAPDMFCLNTACHNITRDELKASTGYMTRNVHAMPHEELMCTDCHKSHRASVNYCTKCHDDATVPEGWISVEEEEALEHYAA